MSDRQQLDQMNEEIDRLEGEGRDLEALNLAERANAHARRMFRERAALSFRDQGLAKDTE